MHATEKGQRRKKIPPTPGFQPYIGNPMSSWGHTQLSTRRDGFSF